MQVVHATITGKFNDVETSQKAISKIIRFAKAQGLILCDISNNAANHPDERDDYEEKVTDAFNGMIVKPIGRASDNVPMMDMDNGATSGPVATS